MKKTLQLEGLDCAACAAELEEEIAALEGEYTKAARDFIRLAELDRQLAEKRELLTEKMDRWMYLEELVLEIEQENKR